MFILKIMIFLLSWNIAKHVPDHSVDCCVERLPLCPEYREDKAVEASPYEANKGPNQPEIAVWVTLDLRGVKMSGAKTKTHRRCTGL